jgi:hypothetical protein
MTFISFKEVKHEVAKKARIYVKILVDRKSLLELSQPFMKKGST